MSLPENFTKGERVGFASIRGSIIVQSITGKLLLLDTSNESLLQQGELYPYEPYGFLKEDSEEEGAARLEGPIKIIQSKA